MTHQTPEEFGAAFEFHRSAFRLELLDYYYAENEAEPLRWYMTGQRQDLTWREPWKELVRDAVQDGKRMGRVHVVSEPLSAYLGFELTCAYPSSVDAGEDIRILRRNDWPNLHLPDHDFWLFDDRNVAVMIYDGDGNFLGAEAYSDPETVTRYHQMRDTVIAHSVPLAEYLGSLGMKEAV